MTEQGGTKALLAGVRDHSVRENTRNEFPILKTAVWNRCYREWMSDHIIIDCGIHTLVALFALGSFRGGKAMLYPGQFVMSDELDMLTRVYKTISQERGLPADNPRCEKVAAHIFKLFMNGLTDEDELLFAVRNRGPLVPAYRIEHRA
ncbi:hypothetical protein [Mesorhizobium sp. B2-8-9]|uniref:hypothetical protein n=1 Tax=Mesorhizobium sp. B2-8-9 TaxID=2589899 RepID=UPI00112E8CDC|nr:hypothetical protein [Mesorhizobium sp. B2-8-9]TPI78002.1 hypothetical protein FJ423_16755 [Mesorhizobium sp. B2-8-9]